MRCSIFARDHTSTFGGHAEKTQKDVRLFFVRIFVTVRSLRLRCGNYTVTCGQKNFMFEAEKRSTSLQNGFLLRKRNMRETVVRPESSSRFSSKRRQIQFFILVFRPTIVSILDVRVLLK